MSGEQFIGRESSALTVNCGRPSITVEEGISIFSDFSRYFSSAFTDCYSMMDYEELVLEKWFAEESQCMAAAGYFCGSRVEPRRRAVRYIVYAMDKTEAQGYGAVVPYFAMSYFDRFISRNNLPILLENEQDNLCLLAFSCLSIAWKMSFRRFNVSKLLHDIGESFCKKKIKSMELHILKALDWRMHAVTSFFFLDYLCRAKVFYTMTRGFKRQYVNRIIIQSQADILFTRFKPSVIAASSLLTATSVVNDRDFSLVLETLMTSDHILKEDLLACMDELHSMCRKTKMLTESWNDWIPRSGGRAPLPPQSPVRHTDVEHLNREEEPYVGDGSEHISETESMILRFEVCQWAGDDTGEDVRAGLQRRREEKLKTQLSSVSLKIQ